MMPILDDVISWESSLASIDPTSVAPRASPSKAKIGGSFIETRPSDVVRAAKDISRSMTAYFQSVLASTSPFSHVVV